MQLPPLEQRQSSASENHRQCSIQWQQSHSNGFYLQQLSSNTGMDSISRSEIALFLHLMVYVVLMRLLHCCLA